MRKLAAKHICILMIAVAIVAAAYRIYSIDRSVQTALAAERSRLNDMARVPFEKRTLAPHSGDDVRIIQNVRETRGMVEFGNSYYAATGGGLIQLSADGGVVRHFTVLDGLPESDLTCLAVYAGRLYIGTQSNGIVVYDGEKFESYTWPDRKAQSVTTLLPDGGDLIIGTFNGGLLKFDGSKFEEIKADKKRILAVQAVVRDGPRLYVGTFNKGLFSFESGVWTHYTTTDGLPSDRITGIVVKDGQIYVATDFGLATSEGKSFRPLVTMPSLSSMTSHGGQLLLAKVDGSIYTYDSGLRQISAASAKENARLAVSGDKVWLLSNQSISEIDGAHVRPFVTTPPAALTDNFVSALAFDGDHNLWVGTFKHGLDVLSPAGGLTKHFETDDIREVNYIAADGSRIRAATTAGIFGFGRDFSITSVLSKKDGLPSSTVNQFSGDTVATAKGLAFGTKDNLRVLSPVQGLPSSSIYTTLPTSGGLYVGTLGGLAELRDGHVERTFKDSNSGLTTNWVTALCRAGDRIFIGTYGGGMFELTPSGEIRSFTADTGKFVVNVNALYSDGERLYAGTLDGLKVLDLQTQAWRNAKNVLPSPTVMSIAGDESAIYVGTSSGIARIDKSFFTRAEGE